MILFRGQVNSREGWLEDITWVVDGFPPSESMKTLVEARWMM